MEIKLNEVELTKLSLAPGDVLLFKFTSNDISPEDISGLREYLKKLFPNNDALVMIVPTESKLDVLKIVSPEVKDCSQPTSYCNDCSCGKKEMIEGAKDGNQQT